MHFWNAVFMTCICSLPGIVWKPYSLKGRLIKLVIQPQWMRHDALLTPLYIQQSSLLFSTRSDILDGAFHRKRSFPNLRLQNTSPSLQAC